VKRQKKYFALGLFIFLIALIFISSVILKKFSRESRVCFTNKCVSVEIADDYAERQTGLMFREELEKDSGMLFVFDKEEFHSFWMKNTLIALDIIWIDENLKIVDIQYAFPCVEEPCKVYTPKEKAKYVLEVKFGFVKENGIYIGDRINFFLD